MMRQVVHVCPGCREIIEPPQFNISEGVAVCPSCHRITHLAELAARVPEVADTVSVNSPPEGCRFIDTGNGVELECSARDASLAMPATGVAVFWNGAVSVFITGATAGWYSYATGIPSSMTFNGSTTPGAGYLSFFTIFLIPFTLIGLYLIACAATLWFGSVRVTIKDGQGRISTGFGPFRYFRSFDAKAVRRIVEVTTLAGNNTIKSRIVLRGGKIIKFAGLLNDDRREWLFVALRTVLIMHE